MKVVLTIAGSDSSGGAGIQADLKTFEAFGVFGTSALTVLTAQNTQGVRDVLPVSAEFLKAQLEAIQDDFEISAIKIGMLYSNEIIDVVREFIKDLKTPVVFDPVFISKAGSKLLNDDAIENMKSILPYATVATPNLFEAKGMFDYEAGRDNKVITSPCAVVVKNHIVQTSIHKKSLDILMISGKKFNFISPYVNTENTHGTGCSFSSAIAANLALGKSLQESVEISKKFIHNAIVNAPHIGHGKGPIAHKIGAGLCQ
ncbi:MAG: bifunctional hydroxymethylpyrimidine kinase/phosphomethylpyrimidine kinase [Helicobacteraceae bacterium]|nr:bifunctional hydroxymethylpyrimidine kinase/phosphomethylpyrimidine kinase [Candidatus Sulfurimonas ponti]